MPDVLSDITRETGCVPQTVVTGANFEGDLLKFTQLKEELKKERFKFFTYFRHRIGRCR